MKRCRQVYEPVLSFLAALLLLLCSISPAAFAAGRLESMRVGFFAFYGYHMVDEDGHRSGYGYDLLQHMVGYTNWQYKYIGYDKSWSEMQDMLANGEIDILTSAQKTPERLKRFDFSDEPIGISSAILTVKTGNSKYMLEDYSNWSGMRIGLLKGNSRNKDLAEFAFKKGFTYKPVYFKNTSELLKALQSGEIVDAVVTSNLRVVDNELVLAKFAPSPFYIIVRKGNKALLSEINRTLELLYCDHANLQTELMNEYYTPDSGDDIAFTAEERKFITEMQKTSFTAFLNPDRIPLSYFKNGKAVGIIGEISAEISRRTGLNIVIKELDSRNEYMSLLGADDENICFDFIHDFSTAEKYGYHLTTPYIDAGISKLHLKNNPIRETAGLVTGSYIVSELKKDVQLGYKKVIFYDTTEDLVRAIEQGKCDVGFFYTRVCERLVLKDIRNRLASELVYGTNIKFSGAVKAGCDPRLFSILDKAVGSLSEGQINPIVRKYVSYDAGNISLVGFIYDNPLLVLSFLITLFILVILIAFIVLIIRKQKFEAKRLMEEKRQNALLSDALTAAKVADESKSRFLSSISHEMRTPLNAVIGFMELAKDAKAEQQRTYRENALVAAKQLLSIINDVLDMSAINMGKLKIASASFDFKQLIHNITNIYAGQCDGKGIELRTVLETPVDEWLVGDVLRLNQILMNLLGNAVKFTDHGFVLLAISQREAENNRVFICFKVSDSGCGMSNDMLSRIGQPFEQQNTTTAIKYGGSGLGLSIVKMLTSMMDGAFNVESTEGVGSTFTVDLPFIKSEKKIDICLPNTAKSLHVLAVDDQASECNYLTAVLSRIKVRHLCVQSAKEALFELDRAKDAGDSYNICLIDWKMPDMDGIALTRRIREKYSKDMIVIVIFAYEYQQNSDIAKEAGADLFVSKPLLQSNLLDLFMTLTGGRMAKPQPVAKKYDFSGRRVLLAEDNAINRMVAEALIKKLGIACESADDGKIALDMFTASAHGYYDAVLMDIQMPNMDGYAATKAIRKSGHPDADSIPILALSANVFNEDVAKSISVGMDDHVAKPINMDELISALERAFAKNRK